MAIDQFACRRTEPKVARLQHKITSDPLTFFVGNRIRARRVCPLMPRYHFHLHEGDARISVAEAVDLPDAEAAWYQAVRSARELLCGRPDRLALAGATVEIQDDEGLPLWAMPISDLTEIPA